MQYDFYFYTAITGLALVIHLIVNWHQLCNWRGVRLRVGALEYRVFLICLLLSFLSDVQWGVYAELRLSRMLFADTVFYFAMMALSVYAWTRFVIVYLGMDGWIRGVLLWTGRGVVACFVAVLALNGPTACLFSVTDAGEYVTGPLRHAVHVLLLAFNGLGSGLTLLQMMRAKGGNSRHNKMVFTFGVTMMAAISLQFADVQVPYYSIGCLLGCCLLHVFLVEEVRDEMHRQALQAREYESQLDAERAANKAKSLFFSTVSHDIRTPLNAIIGFSDLLERCDCDEAERRQYVSSIRSSGRLLARLVDDILDLSKIECGKLEILKEPTDVPRLVREVVAACEVVRARKSLGLATEIGEMPVLCVDPQRVRQIVFNLLSNAYKYTDRGTVTVRAGWSDDGTLTIAVSDTGKGISPENVSRILQPFVQIVDRNHRDGTGLGLPICNRLAALMGGELSVASQVGVGSTFTVTLRGVETGTLPASAASARPVASLAHRPARVLVVDDSSVNRAVLTALLRKCGVACVVTAGDGRAALETLRGDPAVDFVLTDLWMPEMDGYGLIRAVRADPALAHLPVFLVTADVAARGESDSGGFTGVLLKPITLEKLQSLFA